MSTLTWTAIESTEEEGVRNFLLEDLQRKTHEYQILKNRLGTKRIEDIQATLNTICFELKTPWTQTVLTLGDNVHKLHAALDEATKKFNLEDERRGVKWGVASLGLNRVDKELWCIGRLWGACTGFQPIFFIKVSLLPADLLQRNYSSRSSMHLNDDKKQLQQQ